MLPLWRDQILIALAPTQLSLLRTRGLLGKYEVVKQHKQAITKLNDQQTTWAAVLDALKACLAQPAWQSANVKVVIANAFVRYQLLPWSDVHLSADEEQRLAKMRFEKVYGEDKQDWEVRFASAHYGSPRLACAMQREMLSQLREAVRESKSHLRTVAPHLITALNFWRKRLTDQQLYFAMADSEKLCMTEIINGHLNNITWSQLNEPLTEAAMSESIKRIQLVKHATADGIRAYCFVPKLYKADTATIQKMGLQRLRFPATKINSPAAFLASAGVAYNE